MKNKIIVTGGCGYIGSHTVIELIENNYTVIILDDLSNSTEDVLVKRKVFLLFDELNSFKEDLYNSFLQNLTNNVQVDIFFHHFNIAVFKKLISDNIGNYSSYVIMPANLKDVKSTIENLP